MKAVIKVGGKQYYVAEGDEIYVEKLNAEAGSTVEFGEILMVDNKVGNPYVSGAKVTGEVIKNGKQRKIKIFKYHNKTTSSRRTQGHRQPYTKIKITKISA